MQARKFIGGLEVPQTKKSLRAGLKFKIPSYEDKTPALEYHPLTPSQYLNFIETGIKLLPDLKAARERSMLHAPTAKFRLI
ncbi:MAG TPA: hypothetical protein DET40_19090 [Lentisphaeria bacterium]|nr:MAG: hypothetical protein A2X45_25275 [Lentisphaerae bacterium GWF2_50_93]HCE45653.1 hypothetical protein [Lentisphaeria bacterium]